MRSLRRIVESYRSVGERGPSATLATVIASEGPGHPDVGSRMLLIEGGHHSGLIGSDALHHELHETARQVDVSHRARTLSFSTAGSPAQMVREGVGQTVEVLLEPLSGRNDEPAISVLEHCLNERLAVRQATVCGRTGAEGVSQEIGARLAIDDNGSVLAAPDSEALRSALEQAFENLPSAPHAATTTLSVSGTTLRALVERIEPPIGMILFGGGLDACPLVKFGHELGWCVQVVDPDPARANKGRFPLADAVIVSRADDIAERVCVDHRTAAVVMTHQPDQDGRILAQLRQSPAGYIGVAPRDYDARLLSAGDARLAPADEQRIFLPAGLDIGALTAHETAVAILSEIIRRFSGGTA
jgi:xanthine/CO dehydrogenase XdhC/CoxF family maturation factor